MKFYRKILRIFRNDLLVYFQTPLDITLIKKLIDYMKELNKCMSPKGSSRPCRNLQSTMRVLKGYVPVIKIILHGIYSPHVSCVHHVKELDSLWEEVSNFVEIFCLDNSENQKILQPAISYIIEGVSLKFYGYHCVIQVSKYIHTYILFLIIFNLLPLLLLLSILLDD